MVSSNKKKSRNNRTSNRSTSSTAKKPTNIDKPKIDDVSTGDIGNKPKIDVSIIKKPKPDAEIISNYDHEPTVGEILRGDSRESHFEPPIDLEALTPFAAVQVLLPNLTNAEIMWLRLHGLPDVMKPRYVVPPPSKPVILDGHVMPPKREFRTPHAESYLNVFFVAVDAVQMKCQACRTFDDWKRIGADVANLSSVYELVGSMIENQLYVSNTILNAIKSAKQAIAEHKDGKPIDPMTPKDLANYLN